MKSKVLCEQCQKEGKKSIVTPSPLINTDKLKADEFYDEDGKLHQHDPNQYGRHYTCSQGHNWDEYWKNECWCEKK